MDCNKLKFIFESCSKSYFNTPRSNQEILINEAQKYNCILLSNTIQHQCNKIEVDLSSLYQPLVENIENRKSI